MDSQTCSISSEQDKICADEQNTRNFAKQMLQSRLFIGTFEEKRYVESLGTYRDVVSISKDDSELIKDLEIVKKRVQKYYTDLWVGMTSYHTIGAPNAFCLWVELPEEVLGRYWYKISSIKFRHNEILLRLKIVRPVSSSEITKYTQPVLQQQGDEEINLENVPKLLQVHLSNAATITKAFMIHNAMFLFSNVLTFNNTCEALKFLSVLIAAVATGLVQFFQYFGDFSLKFMREISVLIKAITPIVIACINLVEKMIGGFYLLIAIMWRDRKQPVGYQAPRGNPAITYGNISYGNRQNMLPERSYRYGKPVTITRLE